MKETTVAEMASAIPDGATVAFGGKTLHRAPMAFVRALARTDTSEVSAMGLAKSIDVDLLCATGTVDTVYFGYVGFEWLGLAPNFRRRVEEGALDPREESCYTVAAMFRGAAQGVPFVPIAGMDGSELPDVREDSLERITCPFTGDEVLCVRVEKPDVAVIHANEADEEGNARFSGGDLTENLVAKAADKVFVTAERIVDSDRFREAPRDTDIPSVLVDAVAEAPYGAHPCSCPGEYEYDREHLRRYLSASKTGDVQSYLADVLGDCERTYLERAIDGQEADIAWDTARAGEWGRDTDGRESPTDAEVTIAEIMCVALSRRLREKRTVFQGFASPLVTVALRLARSQNSDIVHLSASGSMNGRPAVMPISTEDQHLFEGATAQFTSPEVFDLAARGELDVMFVGSPQIDRRGRLNGSIIGSWDEPKLRFGGSGGTASLLPLIDNGYAWRTEHSPRTLPERVDFTTAAGNLRYVVTPLCEFEHIDGELQVVSLHPGVSRADVEANTGWDVRFRDPDETEPPTDEELNMLRAVDPSLVRRSEFGAEQLGPVDTSTRSRPESR